MKIEVLLWCWGPVSNRRPFALQANALPTELPQHIGTHCSKMQPVVQLALVSNERKALNLFLHRIHVVTDLSDVVSEKVTVRNNW